MSSGFSYPQPIFTSPIYNPAFYLTLDASGYLTYEYAQTLYLDKNDYRLTYITGIIQGTATQGVALVPGINNDISGIGALSCSSLTVNGSSVSSAPAYVLAITPGTAANNKALVLGASGEIGTISSLTATSITGTLQTGAQGNITSLGTLSELTIGGNLVFTGASRMITGLSSISATTITGAVSGSQTGITSLGTLSGLTISGDLTFTGASRSLTGLSTLTVTTITGTLTTAAQTGITSLGTLTGLTSSGAISITATGSGTALPALSCSGPMFCGYGTTILLRQTDAARIAYGSIFTAAYRFGDNGIMDFQDVGGSISVYAHTSFLAPGLTNSPSYTSIATAATCYISGQPIDAGSSYVGITKSYALYINQGDSYFGGRTTSNFITSNNPVAGATFTASTYSSNFNIVCQNNSIANGAFTGIAFHNDVGGLTDTTPSAAIISQRTSATGYEASSIEFWTKSSATQTANLTKRMTIAKDGKISFGSTTTGDGQINLLTAGDASFRFGAALSNKDCFTMSYYHNGPNNDWNKLSWQAYGISNTLALFANGRVCINGNAPESQFHVVSSGILYGSWERAQEWWNDNATPMKAGLIMYNESGGSDNNGVSFGTYTADPLNFMIGGSNCMQLNTSKRLNINRTSGPEGTVHAGGMIWADEGFHSKVNINDKPIYRWNWPQSNYPAIGSDATVGAMRIDTCNGSYVWQAYMPCRGGAYTNASDRRIKRDIIDIPYGLAEVLRMQPKRFAMRNDGSLHIGFIAQEMAEIIPECVSGVESPNDAMNDAGEPCNPMGIDLASLVSVLCKAIQELKKEVDELRAIIAE